MRRPAPPAVDVALPLALARAEAGLPLDVAAFDGLDLPTRRALGLAVGLGAPLAPTLRASVAARDAEAELRAAVRRASAEGRTVARGLVLGPPLLGPLVGALVADQPMAFVGTPVGRVVLVLAVSLWAAGALCVVGLVRGARRAGRTLVGADASQDDELLSLVAVGVRAGLTLPAALRGAAEVVADRGADAAALWLALGAVGDPPPGWGVLGPALAEARRDGVALVPVLEDLAGRARAARRQRALEQAARLPARLTLPTALLLLPAALLVIAAPVVAGALAAVG